MRLILSSALAATVVAISATGILAQSAPKRAAETDQKELQGTWKATESKGFGKDVPAEDLRDLKLTFRGSTITADYNRKRAAATFLLNLRQAGPSEIDVTVKEGPEAVKGKTLHGIYLLEGDTLKVAFRNAGQPRPSDFTETDKPGTFTIWFKRAKS